MTRLAHGAPANAVDRITAVGARLRDSGLPVPAVVDPGWRESTVDILATTFVALPLGQRSYLLDDVADRGRVGDIEVERDACGGAADGRLGAGRGRMAAG